MNRIIFELFVKYYPRSKQASTLQPSLLTLNGDDCKVPASYPKLLPCCSGRKPVATNGQGEILRQTFDILKKYLLFLNSNGALRSYRFNRYDRKAPFELVWLMASCRRVAGPWLVLFAILCCFCEPSRFSKLDCEKSLNHKR